MSTRVAVNRATSAAIVTGVAVIVLPVLAIALKLVAPGWVMIGVAFLSPFLLTGYAVLVVVAATVFFAAGPVSGRVYVAAWTTSVAVVSVGFFLVDSGDTPEAASPFTLVAGDATGATLGGLSATLCLVAVGLWLGSWLWLTVEWIVVLAARTAARAADAAARGRAVAPSDPAAVIAGVALIALPVLGFGVRLAIAWDKSLLFAALPILAAGFAVQAVIAVNGLIRAHGALRLRGHRRRGLTAAWIASASVVPAAMLFVDAAMPGYQLDEPAPVVWLRFLPSAVLLLSWLWLVVEWVAALVARSRRRRRAIED